MARVSYVAPNMWYTRAMGCLLPRGNEDQYPHITRHLKALGVAFEEFPVCGGRARYFIMPETEVSKLPTWKGKPFIPASADGRTGHSIYHITPFQIARML